MASNKIFSFGPVALSATLTTNIFNTTITSLAGPVGYTQTQPYAVIRHIRVVNKTSSAATFSLYKGASATNAAGTEVVGTAVSVPGNSYFDWYGSMRFDAADFLVGGAGTATALTIQGEGELGIS